MESLDSKHPKPEQSVAPALSFNAMASDGFLHSVQYLIIILSLNYRS